MTLSEMIAELSNILNHPIDDAGRLTTAIATAALNRAYLHFAYDTACFQRSVSLNTVISTMRYSLPADCYHVQGVWVAPVGSMKAQPLTYVDKGDMDINYPLWKLGVELELSPYVWTQDNIIDVVLYPVPNSVLPIVINIGIIPSTVVATGAIPTLVTGTDTPLVPALYHDAIPSYAAFDIARKLFTDDAVSVSNAQSNFENYQDLVNKYMAATIPT